MLAIGSLAPDFSLRDQDGKEHSLLQYRGKKVILFFYPKDHTPGCTIEVQNFRDSLDEFQAKGVVILGINGDSEKRHKSFVDKHQLPFSLLSDPERVVIKAYEAKGLGTKRVTYIIDEDGKILYTFPKVKPSNHIPELLAVLDKYFSIR